MAGFQITDGMVYVGPTSGRGSEPSLIDPRLPIDRTSGDRAQPPMPFCSSYDTFAPSSRATYLGWLAGGRRDASVHIGHVFLFFYGCEWRLLRERRDCSLEELQAILRAVEGLLASYGSNSLFRRYAAAFLEAVRATLPESRFYAAPAPTVGCEGAPLALRAGLAHAAVDRAPLPAAWALAWCLAVRPGAVGGASTTCPDELARLFAVRYELEFGGGLVVETGDAKLSLPYRPASPAFGPEVRLVTKLPDPLRTCSIPPRIVEIAQSCARDLGPYDLARRRRVARAPGCLALLPDELLHRRVDDRVAALAAWIDRVVPPDAPVLLHVADLLAHVPDSSPSAPISSSGATEIACLLARFGVGIDPDPRFDGGVLSAAGRVALFRLPVGSPQTPSELYPAAARMVHLAASIARADDAGTFADRERVEEIAMSMDGLPPAERRRLRAHAVRRFEVGAPLGPIWRWTRTLAPDERERLGKFLVGVAAPNGRAAPGKIAALVKAFGALALDPGAVYREAHARGSGPVPADEPVVVRRTTRPLGNAEFAISGADAPTTSNAGGVPIDEAVLARKHAEAAEVLVMLAAILEDEPTAAATRSPTPQGSDVPGLDTKHAALLRRLTERDAWSRADFDDVCSELGLLPEGALEVVNDAAFDQLGGPIVEGDDPLLVDRDAIGRWLR